MTSIDSLMTLVESFCAATGLAEATVSTRLLKDGKRLEAIRAGKDIGTRRLGEAIQWFSDNWPEDLMWPAHIQRPEPAPKECAPA
jgi:hypothetical protein